MHLYKPSEHPSNYIGDFPAIWGHHILWVTHWSHRHEAIKRLRKHEHWVSWFWKSKNPRKSYGLSSTPWTWHYGISLLIFLVPPWFSPSSPWPWLAGPMVPSSFPGHRWRSINPRPSRRSSPWAPLRPNWQVLLGSDFDHETHEHFRKPFLFNGNIFSELEAEFSENFLRIHEHGQLINWLAMTLEFATGACLAPIFINLLTLIVVGRMRF